MSWVDGNVITRTLNYGYNVDGNVTSTADRAASYGFGYDGLNRRSSAASTIAGLSPTVGLASGYDLVGNRTSLDATIGTTFDFSNAYGYDGLNRLTSLTQSQHSGLGVNAVAAKQVAFQYFDDGRGDKLALGGVRRPGAMAYT